MDTQLTEPWLKQYKALHFHTYESKTFTCQNKTLKTHQCLFYEWTCSITTPEF